ncbi:MAG: trypsin-like peptidase domain-containing protein [Thermomicrobiales bacterium]|nr:trypsin-like peptidase domain-containing protein [Thermomicrobiales bacterium]
MTAIAPPSGAAGILNIPAVSDALAALAARVTRSVVQIGQQKGGNGAGVIWRADGIIVTNRHVVRDDRVDVYTDDGHRYTGIVAARHPALDLAVVKIAADLPAAEIGDSDLIRPGELAVAIGHPVGFKASLTLGVVVATARSAVHGGPRGDWIRTDVALLPGNSGGPLVDARGAVIGLNTRVNGDLSLAVPSAAIERFVTGERAAGRANIGVEGVVVPLRRTDFPLGLVVTETAEGGPADRAGLIVGDVIVRVGRRAIADAETLPAALLRTRPDRSIDLAVLRGGELMRAPVTPAAG